MSSSTYSLPVFGSASLSPVPASALAASALAGVQAGVVCLGSDYAATPKAQIPKVDASGSTYAVPVGAAGNPGSYQANSAVATASAISGNVPLALSGLTPQPLTLDSNQALFTVNTPKTSFRALASGVTCSTNKLLVSLTNGSSAIVRISHIYIYVPGAGSGGALLGSSGSTYYPLICELQRLASASSGSALASVPSDSANTVASGIAALSSPTSGTKISTVHRRDAIVCSNVNSPWYQVQCATEQNVVVRPGETVGVVCISNGTITTANGSTGTASVDLAVVFTQAAS